MNYNFFFIALVSMSQYNMAIAPHLQDTCRMYQTQVKFTKLVVVELFQVFTF